MSRTRRGFLVAGNLILWLLAAFLAYARWVEPNWIRVEHAVLPQPIASRNLGNLHIVHLADLHISRDGDLERRLVRTVNDLAPDLIFITGDIAQFYTGTKAAREVVARMRPTIGTYAVLGDADYSNHQDHCLYCHREDGSHVVLNAPFQVLRNDWRIVENGNGRILIAGLDDPVGPCGEPAGDWAPLDASIDLRILLTSSPLAFPRAAEQGFDLVLTGDTHGGQFRIPFVGPVYRGIESAEFGFAGWTRRGETVMFINRGFGTSYLPYRFACPPLVASMAWASRSTGQ